MNHALFDWDDANISHIAEHNVAPEEAEQALMLHPLDIKFEILGHEERASQVGQTATGRVLVIISTLRDERTRVITAFPASRRRQDAYFIFRRTQ